MWDSSWEATAFHPRQRAFFSRHCSGGLECFFPRSQATRVALVPGAFPDPPWSGQPLFFCTSQVPVPSGLISPTTVSAVRRWAPRGRWQCFPHVCTPALSPGCAQQGEWVHRCFSVSELPPLPCPSLNNFPFLTLHLNPRSFLGPLKEYKKGYSTIIAFIFPPWFWAPGRKILHHT